MNTVEIIAHRYRLHEQLGAGGMGAVYRAYDRLNATDVALKQVNIPLEFLEFMSRATLGATTGLWTALAEEFKTLASLRHPHIISVLDYGFDADRQPFYTMELLRHPATLLAYGADKTIPDKINLIIQVLQALAYLHRRGVIHRDLKPDNVLVVDGQAKVLDFGLAVTRGRQAEDLPAGTLHYMAPEVLSGQSTTVSADLYAVGVMAYQLLTGKLPFQTDGSIDALIDSIIGRSVDMSMLAVDDLLSSVISKLLTKMPAERYASATECILALSQAVGQEPPPETAALRESFIQAAEFVGRQQELQQLNEAMQGAISGNGSAWLVGGESGVGKSRLLDELRTQALVEGALVVRGQAVEGGGLPYQLWREPLRRLVLSVELSDFEAGVLKPIVPDVSRLLERAIPDATELPGEAGQQRLMLTIMDVFKRQRQPVALLLEDLQWSSESLEPLKRLNALASELPLLVVANYRSDERPGLPVEMSGMKTIPLERLNHDEIAELSAGMLGEGGRDPMIVERLQRETEGNTFFMVEVVRALGEAAGRLGDIGNMTLPHSIMAGGIQKIVHRRLEHVPKWGQSLLRLAAVAGRQIDLGVLDTLIVQESANIGEHTRDEWLRTCADAAVIEIMDERWRFSHDKLREGLVNELTVDERVTLHRAVAQSLESVHGEDVAYAEALADHWKTAGDSERALPYLIQAVERMVITADFQNAERRIDYGLSHANQMQRAVLLRLQSDSALARSEYELAERHFRTALDAAGDDTRLRVDALNGLCEALWMRQLFSEARSHAQMAYRLANEVGYQRGAAKGLINLGAIDDQTGDPRSAKTHLEEALRNLRDVKDEAGSARALNILGLTSNNLGDFASARTYLLESLEVRRAIGDQTGTASSLLNLGMVAAIQGDVDNALRYNDEAVAICRKVGRWVGLAMGRMNSAILLSSQGDYQTAQAYLDECLPLFEKVGNMDGVARVHLALGEIAGKKGNYPNAYIHFENALQLFRNIQEPDGVVSALTDKLKLLVPQGELTAALPLLIEAITISLELELEPQYMAALIAAADFAQVSGQSSQSALALGRILTEPDPSPETTRFIQELTQKLEQALGTERLTKLLEEGKLLDTKVLLGQLLTEVSREEPH